MKKIILNIVLILLLMGVASPSLTAAEEDSRPEVRPFRNVFTFLRQFVDPDSNIRYLTDDLLISNQCKKRDIFAIHAAKDAIADRLIAEYTRVDTQTLNDLKKRYALLTAELKYVRNVELLAEEDGRDQLERMVLNRSNNDYSVEITAALEEWYSKYAESSARYADCPNSWTQVKDRVESVKTRAGEISTAYQDLKKTLVSLKNTVRDTPAAFYDNTTSTIGDGISTSWQETLGNAQDFGRGIRTELEQLKLSPDRETFRAIREAGEQNATAQSVENLVSRESNLIEITESIRNEEATRELNEEIESLTADLSINNDYTDSSNINLFVSMYDANLKLAQTNQVFSTDNEGIVDLAKSVHKKQCRSR